MKCTDHSFRNKIDSYHHIGTTPLIELPIDMINTFYIDYMHCLLLGVMRTLIRLWLTGCHQNGNKCKSTYRLSQSQIDLINEKSLFINKQIPRYFVRKPIDIRAVDMKC